MAGSFSRGRRGDRRTAARYPRDEGVAARPPRNPASVLTPTPLGWRVYDIGVGEGNDSSLSACGGSSGAAPLVKLMDKSSSIDPGGGGRDDAAEAGRRIADALRLGRRVAMFLDYDGTLREIEAHPADATPTPAVIGLLDALALEGRIDVTIISGRTCEDLESFLAGYPFGLVAEHGASFRRPRSADWESVEGNAGHGWKDRVRDILGGYADSTPGSFVEEKRTSLVWHYRRSDPVVGERKARQLLNDVAAATEGQALSVRPGRKIVEVTPAGITKGAAVRAIAGRGGPYEWIAVAGDDVTDESMFALDLPHLLSIKVGEGGTAAKHRVASPESLRRLLRQAIAGAG